MSPTSPTAALSVAEIQAALRDLRARHTDTPSPTTGATGPDPDGAVPGAGGWRADWVAVVAAHAGAGASAVALMITDALSAAGRRSRLIELADPVRSGLLAAADAELGVDPSGCWRRGRRGPAAIFRRADHRPVSSWPQGDAADTVIDAGLPGRTEIDQLAADRPRLVVVCRTTVPGARAAARLLDELGYPPGASLAVAAVGSRHWPGPVTAAGGRPLARLKTAGRVVSVPLDGRLQTSGLTADPLPRQLIAAGRALAERIHPALLAGDHSAAATPPAPGEESR